MGTSSDFGNMFSMAAATLFLPFLPMLPTQILLNNFLHDLAQGRFRRQCRSRLHPVTSEMECQGHRELYDRDRADQLDLDLLTFSYC